MYNKNEYRKKNCQKLLHKVGKHWVTISIALLSVIGGSTVVGHADASENHALATEPDQVASTQQDTQDNQAEEPVVSFYDSVPKQILDENYKSVSNLNQIPLGERADYNGSEVSHLQMPSHLDEIDIKKHNYDILDAYSVNDQGFCYQTTKGTFLNNPKIPLADLDQLRDENQSAKNIYEFVDGRPNNSNVALTRGEARSIEDDDSSNELNNPDSSFDNSASASQSASVSKSASESAVASQITDSIAQSVSASQTSSISINNNILRNNLISNSLAQLVTSESNRAQSSASLSNEVRSNRIKATHSAESISQSLEKRLSSSASVARSASVKASLASKRADFLAFSVSASRSASTSVSLSNSALASLSVSNSNRLSQSANASFLASTSNSLRASSLSASVSASDSNSISASINASKSISLSNSISASANVARSTLASISASTSVSASISASKSANLSDRAKSSINSANHHSLSSSNLSNSMPVNSSSSSSALASASKSSSLSNSASLSASISTSASIAASNSTQNSLNASTSASQSTSASLSASVAASESSDAKSLEGSSAHPIISSSQVNQYEEQIASATFQLLNSDRATSNGLSPLQLDSGLNKVARERANQCTNYFGHYTSRDHQAYMEIDANNLGVPLNDYGENLAITALGHQKEAGTNNSGQSNSTVYNAKNGYWMAYIPNDGMMNWDANSEWMHRKNIMDSSMHYIGIGVSYSNRNGKFYIVENFGDHSTDYNQNYLHITNDIKFYNQIVEDNINDFNIVSHVSTDHFNLVQKFYRDYSAFRAISNVLNRCHDSPSDANAHFADVNLQDARDLISKMQEFVHSAHTLEIKH